YLTNDAIATDQIGYDGINVTSTNATDGSGPSGFWITNPSNTFTGNSVAGCQGYGIGYWFQVTNAYTALTEFSNNRAHGCYDGLTSASDGIPGAIGQDWTPSTTGDNTGPDVLTYLDGMTATRNRNRGIWLRPAWYHVDNARLATNRDSISLV